MTIYVTLSDFRFKFKFNFEEPHYFCTLMISNFLLLIYNNNTWEEMKY